MGGAERFVNVLYGWYSACPLRYSGQRRLTITQGAFHRGHPCFSTLHICTSPSPQPPATARVIHGTTNARLVNHDGSSRRFSSRDITTLRRVELLLGYKEIHSTMLSVSYRVAFILGHHENYRTPPTELWRCVLPPCVTPSLQLTGASCDRLRLCHILWLSKCDGGHQLLLWHPICSATTWRPEMAQAVSYRNQQQLQRTEY
jgi:hypothetical protein